MFKLNYKQFLSLPIAFVKYGNTSWLCEKFFVWTLPLVTRDLAFGIFVVSFCFIKHRSSHFLLLYVIISFSIYYYWVRFLQLKYTEPLYGQLQATLDLAFDIKYLYRLVALSPYVLGFFSHICTIGLYLFYAGKSIVANAEQTGLSLDVQVSGIKLVPFQGLMITKALYSPKGFGLWLESVKNSSAGFFPISMTSLLHLQCVKDYMDQDPTGRNLDGFGYLEHPTKETLGRFDLTRCAPPRVQFWSAFYQRFIAKRIFGMPGKYISFAYMFDNMGGGPFFGRFTTDLELMKFLGNFSFEKFSLLQFFRFSFQTAFRLWIPIFPLGYKDWLAWWRHPYSEFSLINLIGQSRYLFEPFMIGVSLVLDNSIQQIYASFYMDKWLFPLYHFLNKGNELRPATLLETRNSFLNSLLDPGPFGGGSMTVTQAPSGRPEVQGFWNGRNGGEAPNPSSGLSVSELAFKPTKLSHFILTVAGYTLKYAGIYVPCEQARIRSQLLIFEILFFRPFIIAFKILAFGLSILPSFTYYLFLNFIPEVIFNPF